jgi:hypothetical protein
MGPTTPKVSSEANTTQNSMGQIPQRKIQDLLYREKEKWMLDRK